MPKYRILALVVMGLAVVWALLIGIMIVHTARPDTRAYAWIPLLLPVTLFLWGLGLWFRKGLLTCVGLLGLYGCFLVLVAGAFLVALTRSPIILPLPDIDLNLRCARWGGIMLSGTYLWTRHMGHAGRASSPRGR